MEKTKNRLSPGISDHVLLDCRRAGSSTRENRGGDCSFPHSRYYQTNDGDEPIPTPVLECALIWPGAANFKLEKSPNQT